MINKLLLIPIILLILWCNSACHPGTPADIAAGELLFNQQCSGCHNFRQDGIGPQLSGLTTTHPAAWVKQFIQNPQAVINSGDKEAQEIFKKYKVVMPSFAHFSDAQLMQLVAFINTHKQPDGKETKEDKTALSNPIPDTIQLSKLVVNIAQVAQFPPSGDSGKLPLTRITKLDAQPATNALFVLDLRGKLYRLRHNKPFVFMDMAKLEPRFINEPGLATGFGSFAFHPQFARNGLLYTTHTEPAGSAKADFGYADSIKVTLQWVLTEWKTDNPADTVFIGKGRELLRINMVSGIHGVQEITFNPLSKPGDEDYGLLYIGVGEGGCVENGYPFLAHSPGKVWGTVLRINPAGSNSANGRYGIPPQNPFAKSQHALGEVYAYGFRNPHRITWTKAGQMLVSNVGHGNIESLNLVEKGHDYGWPIREGSFLLNPLGDLNKVHPLTGNDSAFHITYPVAQYDHDEGKAISGGFEYTGTAIPQLMGKFLFGDIPTGRLFYINIADIKQGKRAVIQEWKVAVNGAVKSIVQLCGSDRADLHFGKDAAGELYILTKPDGKMYKLINAGEK